MWNALYIADIMRESTDHLVKPLVWSSEGFKLGLN